MIYFFITGDSSGIGAALRSIVQEKEDHFVYGISRRARKPANNYTPLSLDLSKIDELSAFQFPDLEDADEIVLVNNAGQIGPIKPLFEQSSSAIESVFQVNTIAPAILISKLIQKYPKHKRTIINISSGAANNPIQAWSTYCASKAALDMLSKTLEADLDFRGIDNVQVYSVSPGVIDTAMQEEIRSSGKSDFEFHQKFEQLKNNGDLIKPEITAELIYRIIEKPSFYTSNSINLRDYY